ncbi:hypothetical protein BDB01DRAFT_899031 [Pilobolus umbonatus]|nr:hypothetical protein BDB01DRAFT_899031 [Pilobolus umbonatus]
MKHFLTLLHAQFAPFEYESERMLQLEQSLSLVVDYSVPQCDYNIDSSNSGGLIRIYAKKTKLGTPTVGSFYQWMFLIYKIYHRHGVMETVNEDTGCNIQYWNRV